jgi:large subunit ribosomal protein L28
MAKVCDLCGRGPQLGNRISHANNVTKRRWDVNLQKVYALVAGAPKRIKVCTDCIKSGKVQKQRSLFSTVAGRAIPTTGHSAVTHFGAAQ